MQRDQFLAGLREANRLAGDPVAPDLPPLPPSTALLKPLLPTQPGSTTNEDLAARLTQELERVQGVVQRVASVAEARLAVLKIVEQSGAQRAIRADTAGLRELQLDAELAKAGVEVTVDQGEDAARGHAFSADVGITTADYGVAETGSLAIITRPGQERSTSLLPPVHVALLRSRDIVYQLGDLFARALDEHGALPSALTLITGASRTGDIELVLTVGVHGPGEVYLVLID